MSATHQAPCQAEPYMYNGCKTQFVVTVDTSGEYTISLSRQSGSEDCPVLFFIQELLPEQYGILDMDLPEPLYRSEYEYASTQTVVQYLNDGSRYAVVGLVDGYPEEDVCVLEVSGAGSVSIIEPPNREYINLASEWTRAKCGGYRSTRNPQFRIVPDKDTEIYLKIQRDDWEGDKPIYLFVIELDSASNKLVEKFATSSIVAETSREQNNCAFLKFFAKANVSYIAIACLDGRMLTGFQLHAAGYQYFTVTELGLESCLVQNECREILNKYREHDTDIYFKEDPAKEIIEYLESRSELFLDHCFPPNDNSVNWDDGRNRPALGYAAWKRPSEFMNTPEVYVNGISVDDITQGSLGNCWFCQGVAGITSRPDLVQKLIYPSTYSPTGVYSVRLYIYNEWKYVLVDDHFPVSASNKPVFAQSNDNDELWIMILEKAVAKTYFSYRAMTCKNSCIALEMLTGGEVKTVVPTPTDENIWKEMVLYSQKKWLMGLGSSESKSGIYSGHAYTLLSVIELPQFNNLRLCKVRNTWGRGEFTGDYSDNSSKWTKELKEYVGFQNKNDGIFYMTFEDLCSHYTDLHMCKITQDLTRSYPYKYEQRGKWNSAGGGFKVKSNNYVLVEAKRSVDLVVELVKKSAFNNLGDKQKYIFALVVKDDGTEVSSDSTEVYSDEQIVAKTDEYAYNEQKLLLQVKLNPGKYRIVPCLFSSNYQGTFIVHIHSSHELQISDYEFAGTEAQVKTLWKLDANNINNAKSLQPVLSSADLESTSGIVVLKSKVYIIADYIYLLNEQEKKLEQASIESGWYEYKAKALGDNIYLISNMNGSVVAWNPETRQKTVVTNENWTNGTFVTVKENNYEYLYVFCKYIYRYDVHNNKYETMSLEGTWMNSSCACVLGRELVVTDSVSGFMYSWNMDTKAYKRFAEGNWKNYRPILSIEGEQLLSFGQKLYLVDNSGKFTVLPQIVKTPFSHAAHNPDENVVWCL